MTGDIGRRDPMLGFIRQEMIDHMQQPLDDDLNAKLLANLSLDRILQPFAECDSAAGEFPAATFVPGGRAALCQEDLAFVVKDHRTNPNSNVVVACLHPNSSAIVVKPASTHPTTICAMLVTHTKKPAAVPPHSRRIAAGRWPSI